MEGAENVAIFSKNIGCFLNLNELEFSDTNAEEMKLRGYTLMNDESNTVRGSSIIAKKAFDVGGKINFCTSRYKDAIQLRLRLLRTAQRNARPFDEITEDGTLIYGRINLSDLFLEPFLSFLKEMELPEESYVVYPERNIVETACGIVEELAAIFKEDDISDFGQIKFWIVERYPFENGFIVGCDPIF